MSQVEYDVQTTLPVITSNVGARSQKQMKCLINWSVSEKQRLQPIKTCTNKLNKMKNICWKWDCRTTRYPWYTPKRWQGIDDPGRSCTQRIATIIYKIGQRVIGSWWQGYDHWHLACTMPIQTHDGIVRSHRPTKQHLSIHPTKNVSTPWMKMLVNWHNW